MVIEVIFRLLAAEGCLGVLVAYQLQAISKLTSCHQIMTDMLLHIQY